MMCLKLGHRQIHSVCVSYLSAALRDTELDLCDNLQLKEKSEVGDNE